MVVSSDSNLPEGIRSFASEYAAYALNRAKKGLVQLGVMAEPTYIAVIVSRSGDILLARIMYTGIAAIDVVPPKNEQGEQVVQPSEYDRKKLTLDAFYCLYSVRSVETLGDPPHYLLLEEQIID